MSTTKCRICYQRMIPLLPSLSRSRLLVPVSRLRSKNYATQPTAVASQEEEERKIYLKRSKEVLETNIYEPKVDLGNTRGISVNHMTKENATSALLRQCLSEQPDKQGFFKAVDVYVDRNKKRHGHMEFIVTALKFIEPYGLSKDLGVYNKLLDVFPKDKFVNRSLFDAIWPKQHPQMNLALDILTKMEWQGVIPDEETHDLLFTVFGRASFPLKKLYRMWFWFETLKDINPYSLPDEVYKDRLNVIRAGITRILGDNNGTKILEISPGEENKKMVIDYQHFIVSSQSTYQKQCTATLEASSTVFVEGPISLWMNHVREEYFILKTGRRSLLSTDHLQIAPDEEREGVVLAVCFATRPYKENVTKWLAHLQSQNESLKDMNIVIDVPNDIMDAPLLSSV